MNGTSAAEAAAALVVSSDWGWGETTSQPASIVRKVIPKISVGGGGDKVVVVAQ